MKRLPNYGILDRPDPYEEGWNFEWGLGDEHQYFDRENECILSTRDKDTILDSLLSKSNKKYRKSIAYPERDIHELYPYVEEILIESDSGKN